MNDLTGAVRDLLVSAQGEAPSILAIAVAISTLGAIVLALRVVWSRMRLQRAAAMSVETVREQLLSTFFLRSKSTSIVVVLLSGIIGLFALTSALYMLEVYDRVLVSGSIPSLIAVSAIALLAYVGSGFLEIIRARLINRVALLMHADIQAELFAPLSSTHSDNPNHIMNAIRDLDTVRTYLIGAGPVAFLDLPWCPLFLLLVYALHPYLGIVVFLGSVALLGLGYLSESLTRRSVAMSASKLGARNALATSTRRNAEVLHAMGMARRFREGWESINADFLRVEQRLADVSTLLKTVARTARTILQSAVLGVGAYLVIVHEASAGVIIASSILSARAFAPVETLVASWRGFIAARQGWAKIEKLIKSMPKRPEPLLLPPPSHSLTVEGVSFAPPDQQRLTVVDVSFALRAGQGLGILGPSASGKSSLARLLVGVWHPVRGRVRLDGATLEQWSAGELGQHIGYMPQTVDLFGGTIAQNIARFDPEPRPDDVIAAAHMAGVHDLILAFPNGYNTLVGDNGSHLSAGQRQRIALARALYKDPFLVVLDEPNSNLDVEGETALSQAISAVRARGGILVVVAHRPSAVVNLDTILYLQNGRTAAFGPKDEVYSSLARPQSTPAAPLRPVREAIAK